MDAPLPSPSSLAAYRTHFSDTSRGECIPGPDQFSSVADATRIKKSYAQFTRCQGLAVGPRQEEKMDSPRLALLHVFPPR